MVSYGGQVSSYLIDLMGFGDYVMTELEKPGYDQNFTFSSSVCNRLMKLKFCGTVGCCSYSCDKLSELFLVK